MVYVEKNATLIKIDCAVALLWFASRFVREVYCDTFCQTCRDFCQHAVIQQNVWHFHGKMSQSLENGALSGIA